MTDYDHRDVELCLNELRSMLKKRKSLNPLFFERFGDKTYSKAWTIASEKRVKKYLFQPSGKVEWIVVGRGKDYLVMPIGIYCSCDDFFINLGKKKYGCVHLLAQAVSEALDMLTWSKPRTACGKPCTKNGRITMAWVKTKLTSQKTALLKLAT